MTDPNDRHETRVYVTPERRSGGGWMAFVIGGVVVAVAVIAWFVYAGGAAMPSNDTKVDIDVDMPAPNLPEAPKMPDLPAPPPVEPPTMPQPGPAQ